MRKKTKQALLWGGGALGVGGLLYWATRPATPAGLAFGKKVSSKFANKVTAIANKYGFDPSFLMAAIDLETAGTFSPSIENPLSGAIGLIQFTSPAIETLRAHGHDVTKESLGKMSDLEQLDYVDAYLGLNKGAEARDLTDVYLTIFFPNAVGQKGDFVLFSKDGAEASSDKGKARSKERYEKNPGADFDKDGVVTKEDIRHRIQGFYDEGMKEANRS